MATSVKSKAELEQVALAMMMMAGGEGTSSPAAGVEVGVKTRSSRRASFPQVQNQPNNNHRRGRGEPVSGNYLNKNKNRRYQPESPEDEEEEYYENHEEIEEEDPLDQSPAEEESATDLVLMKPEGPDEAIICAINPLSIQSSPSPGSPAGSSTNSGSGGSGAGGGGNGGNVPGSNNDCIYMSSSRRIFRPEFKQKVLDAFASDPECVGNQRATARKFGIHRRQVQKWLQQLATGELSFKDSQQQLQQNQGDNEDPYSEPTELTSRKLIQQQRSSQGNPPIRSASGKIGTRRSTGGGNTTSTNRESSGNNSQESNSVVGRASDPPSRPTRSSVRNRGNKSMPLKGGSKSTAQYVPTLVHPLAAAASSSATSPSLINLSKGGKHHNGGGTSNNATATSSSYAYYNNNDSNGNGATSGSTPSNMFMNMSTLLASAAAAGNLAMPLSLENPRNFSPRDHSPINNNGRGSPTHSAGGSSGGSHNSSLQNALLLVDELNFLYPYSDFSLLRKALLKEEVSLEKLAHPLIRGNKSTEFRVNGNGLNSDLNQGLRELRRAAAMSPSPAKSTSSREEYNTQQTLDILRQQQEYLKLLQQCGIGNSNDLTSGLNLADLSNNGSNGRIPAWFNPFAAAAAAGLSVPSTSGGKLASGSSGPINGNVNESNSRRNNMKQDANDNHRFASPRVPPAANSNKAKTVAAALAATRVQPTSTQQQQQQIIGGRNFVLSNNQQNGRSQNQKNAQRRKAAANARQAQAASRGGAHQLDEDMIDPTSMLEVVTSIPSPSNSPAARSNQYGYNGGHQRNNGNNDYQQGQGMDLSTTSNAQSSLSNTTSSSSSTRLISKAMNKEYSFLNELGLIRKSPEKESIVSTTTTTSGRNGYGLTHTASLENFVENILPPRQKSPQAACSSTSSSSPPASDLSDSEKTKNMVIDAFTYDPEISGDARAVARKFGLNVRVVMKWLKEAPAKNSSPQENENGLMNNDMVHVGLNGGGGYSDEEDSKEYVHAQIRNIHSLQKAMINESNNNSTGSNAGGVNKRKNSKPNQICDFPAEDDGGLNGALDMVVPIKKRRVSSPNPTAQDA